MVWGRKKHQERHEAERKAKAEAAAKRKAEVRRLKAEYRQLTGQILQWNITNPQSIRRRLEKAKEEAKAKAAKSEYKQLTGERLPPNTTAATAKEWLEKAKEEAKAAAKTLNRLGISGELKKMVNYLSRMSIDDIAFIHARGWVGDKTMRPVIDSILNGTGKGRLTVEQGEALYRFREHGELLAAVASGERTTKWAIALMEGGFSESPEAIRMVLGGMSAAAARRAYGLGLGPEPDEPEPEPDEPEPEPEPDEDVIL